MRTHGPDHPARMPRVPDGDPDMSAAERTNRGRRAVDGSPPPPLTLFRIIPCSGDDNNG